MFAFEMLHRLHLEINKFVNECTVDYLSPDRLRAGVVQEEDCL